MDLYFTVLLPRVISQTALTLKKAKATTAPAMTTHSHEIPSPQLLSSETVITERQATDVWCTLVLRMLCWLLLHDFHNKDVQCGNKSGLLGSRIPVYII